jgi:hypothetical protein
VGADGRGTFFLLVIAKINCGVSLLVVFLAAGSGM